MSEYKTFVIRLQVKRGSQEEQLLEFLNSESARPFSKPQMILLALKAFWLTLSLFHHKQPAEQILASLSQGTYLWKLQEQYLRKVVGVEEKVPTSNDYKTCPKYQVSEQSTSKLTEQSTSKPTEQSTSKLTEQSTSKPTEQSTFTPFGDVVSIK
ncbi:hypothetical protein LC605_27630 [Nostoc sp. CHAB 5836]|uniref:hypothetical protein n=1 Tax=Nostoc sp. CHAB 5836 TaxID=2780404 RepID=UPI001E56CD92|nr:hypothetical protein [Nostoc sp. CHAB 5836]MCC5618791.1 hypothetical protein [Nostoc sp. CHAB 5836]